MSTPTGLFERNGHFYLRVIIPTHQRHLFNGRTRIVQSLNTCHKRQAIVAATLLRAEILSTLLSQGQRENALTPSGANITNQPKRRLRDVFERWRDCGTRSKDTLLACERALKLFESLTDNKTIEAITRADGDSGGEYSLSSLYPPRQPKTASHGSNPCCDMQQRI